MIIYNVQFTPKGKSYSYISDEDSFNVGDVVIVCAGKDNHEAAVRIVDKSPYDPVLLSIPVDQVKHILRLANEEEKSAFAKLHHSKSKKKQDGSDCSHDVKKDDSYVAEGLQPDGSFVISYSDSYNGVDVEVTYNLDQDNTEKLRAFLSERYQGSIESMLIQECGYGYRKKGLSELFDEIGLKYGHFIWMS